MKCPHCQAENEASAESCASCGRALRARRASPWDDLSPGTVFDSRYKIVSTLGRGGMGTVYKARDLTLEEIVAIKVLRPEYASDPKMTERFKSEIKLARKVRHKNVCTIHDYGEYRSFLYISMEFITGVDLKRVLKKKGAPPREEAYKLAIQVAEGLQAVHDAGIIHRDLKASNLMMDTTGIVRLMDFGVAKQYGSGGTITATGQIVGTPEYMSPEQAQGHKLDFRSDIYAIGVLIYELFAGRVPFKGDTPISTILKHINEPPPLYGAQSAKIPGPLLPVLRKALAKKPDKRQSSMGEFIEELRQASLATDDPQSMPTALQEGTTLLAPWSVDSVKPKRLGRSWVLACAATFVALFGLWIYRNFAPSTPMETADTSISSPAGTSTSGGAVPGSEDPTPVATTSTTRPLPSEEASTTAMAPTTSIAPIVEPTPSVRAPANTSTVPPPVTTTAASTTVPITSSLPPTTTVITGSGWLQIAVIPWAEVRVDGKLIGTTPLDRIPVSAGSHVIRIRHPDYEPIEKTVTVGVDETKKEVVNLRREGKRK